MNISICESDMATDSTLKLYLNQKYPMAELYLVERCVFVRVW